MLLDINKKWLKKFNSNLLKVNKIHKLNNCQKEY